MSNSNLVNYTKLSPNYSARGSKINKITIHHMAGNLSVETCGNVFSNPNREASSNYGVGTDARIGLYVDEANRSWASSNYENDRQAVTIEVANDEIGGSWHVSDAALNKTIELCVDICRRNGIARLNFTGDKNGNLTQHNFFANTNCPGAYLGSKFSFIADEVNRVLTGGNSTPTLKPPVITPTPSTNEIKTSYNQELAVGKTLRIKYASSWSIYPTDKAPVKANAIGSLNPKSFGDNGILEYIILGLPQANVVTIKTRDFGNVNIYVEKGDSEWDVVNKVTVSVSKPTPPLVNPQPSNGEYKVNSYDEKGVFTCTVDSINFRNNPLILNSNPIVGQYFNGETVTYDYVYITNLYVYISWISGGGIRRYMPVRDKSNGEVWGEFK